jgi:hypothetical protein
MSGSRSTQVATALALSLSLSLFATRSASADETDAPVKGVVHVEGKPVVAGKIIFYVDDDEFVGAKIKDGKYKITRVPAGNWRVAIESKEVPEKFWDEETSGLQVRIKARVSNTIDFDLK